MFPLCGCLIQVWLYYLPPHQVAYIISQVIDLSSSSPPGGVPGGRGRRGGGGRWGAGGVRRHVNRVRWRRHPRYGKTRRRGKLPHLLCRIFAWPPEKNGEKLFKSIWTFPFKELFEILYFINNRYSLFTWPSKCLMKKVKKQQQKCYDSYWSC